LTGIAAVRIRRAGSRDTGKYVCIARNLSGEAESVCVVRFREHGTSNPRVEAPKTEGPKFTQTLQDVTVNDGENIQ